MRQSVIEEALRDLEEQRTILTAAIDSLERYREINAPIRQMIRHLERERTDLVESHESLVGLSQDPRRTR